MLLLKLGLSLFKSLIGCDRCMLLSLLLLRRDAIAHKISPSQSSAFNVNEDEEEEDEFEPDLDGLFKHPFINSLAR